MFLVVLYLFLAFFIWASFAYKKRFFPSKLTEKSLPSFDVFSTFILSLSLIFGGTYLYIFNFYLPLHIGIFALILLLSIFYFSHKNYPIKQKTLLNLALCAIGVWGILMPLPQLDGGYWITSVLLIFCWWLGWRLFCHFDNYGVVSYANSTAWALAIFFACFIFQNFSMEMGAFAGVLGTSAFVISRKRFSYGIFNLGPDAAELVGFIWGGLWVSCLLYANPIILVLAYTYYIMELLILLYQRLRGIPQEPLFPKVLVSTDKNSKIITSVVFHVFIASFFAVFFTVVHISTLKNIGAAFVLGLAINLNLYNQLIHKGKSFGSWKELFSAVKGGLTTLPKASKEMFKSMKNDFENCRSTKKTTAHKKTARRKKKK